MKLSLTIAALTALVTMTVLCLSADPQQLGYQPSDVPFSSGTSVEVPHKFAWIAPNSALFSAVTAVPPGTNMLSVDNLVPSPTVVVANVPTVMTVTIPITGASYIANSATLLRVGVGNTPTSIIGQLYDDGTHGDVTAGDHIFTAQITLDEPSVGQFQLEASAAFKGVLKRVLSLPLTIPIYQRYSQAGAPVSFGYPPFTGVPFSIDVVSGGTAIAFDVSTGSGIMPAFTISVAANPSRLSLNDWFSQNIDSSGLLLDEQTYSSITLSDGTQGLILSGGVPSDWSGGPLQEAFIMSPDDTKIAVIQISNDDPLTVYGISSDSLGEMVNTISQTIQFP